PPSKVPQSKDNYTQENPAAPPQTDTQESKVSPAVPIKKPKPAILLDDGDGLAVPPKVQTEKPTAPVVPVKPQPQKRIILEEN
ncbi:MAG: hypothetical protein LBT46_13340, partial [Planctomycetaceae bacterium]|nr:hypothetical protein [Planctomycetaceae bacterium]